jgi:hypothetical protein
VLKNSEDEPASYSKVTYQLSSLGQDTTLLDITEDNFEGNQARFQDAIKFWNTLLPSLKELLEE